MDFDELSPILDSIKLDALLFAKVEGMGFIDKNNPVSYDTCKFSLFPTPIPEKFFSLANRLQPNINLLLHKIANSKQFLEFCLGNSVKSNEFIRNLYEIYLEAYNDPNSQKVSLGLNRTDFMINENPNQLKVVEFNTISISLSNFGTKITKLHNILMRKYKLLKEMEQIPKNYASQTSVEGLFKAWEFYGKSSAVILFVVQEKELNIGDIFMTEFGLYKLNPQIRTIRRTFQSIKSVLKIGENRELIIDNDEVAVVYYRTGYTLKDHSFPNAWEVRRKIELSKAIKCPSIGLQLAGTKLVQCSLNPESLNQFMNKEQSDEIYSVMPKSYFLRNEKEINEVRDLVLKYPDNFILKYEEEGGGHNFFGNNIIPQLEKIRETNEKDAYTLWETIKSKSHDKLFHYKGDFVTSKAVSEMGIYSYILMNGDEVISNKTSGFILKTKPVEFSEGGICAGFSAVDSVILY